jgi:hypothetical protein
MVGALFAFIPCEVFRQHFTNYELHLIMKNIIILTTVVVSLTGLFATTPVEAKQYVAPDGKIVHTRLAPVVAHRISPPFHGRHVYRRR